MLRSHLEFLPPGARVTLGAAALAAIYLISAPLLMLLVTAVRGPEDFLPFEADTIWTLEHLRAVYLDASLYTVTMPDTVVFVTGSVVLTFLIAFVLAWLVERTDLPAADAVYTLLLFPLLVPTVVLAIAWIYLLGPNAGWLNLGIRMLFRLEGPGPIDLFSMPGLIACQGAALVPFVFLLLSGTLRTMNPALEEASATAGAGPWTTFVRVTLPVLRPGLLAPLILAILVTLEQFEIPLMLGLPARITVFSTRIFYELNPDSGLPVYGRAAAVALPFLLAGIGMLTIYNRLIRQADRYVTIGGRGFQVRRLSLGRWRWPALGFVALYVLFTSVLPTAVLVWISMHGFQTPSWSRLSMGSLEAYATVLGDVRFRDAEGNTFLVAGLSATIVTVIGALLAWTIVRGRMPGRAVLDFVSFMSIGIPSVIAGLAAMVLYLTLPLPIYGTVWILVLAYSYRLAVTTRLSRAGLMQIHPELEEASAAAGGRWGPTFRRVVLPLLRPSLVAGFVLLFIIGFREFTLPMVLSSPDNIVLSVMVWRLFEDGSAAEAAAVATLIIALVVPVIFVMRRTVLAESRRSS